MTYSYLALFLRYGDLFAENCEFFLPVGEDFVILACVVFVQCQRVRDGQTDGRTSRL